MVKTTLLRQNYHITRALAYFINSFYNYNDVSIYTLILITAHICWDERWLSKENVTSVLHLG